MFKFKNLMAFVLLSVSLGLFSCEDSTMDDVDQPSQTYDDATDSESKPPGNGH